MLIKKPSTATARFRFEQLEASLEVVKFTAEKAPLRDDFDQFTCY
jgi:hypothetical protein